MTGRIETNRRQIDARPRARRWATPALHGLETRLTAALVRSARGDVLDVGCGSMPYRELIERSAERYDGLDVEVRHPDVRYVASATDMHEVPDDEYDTLLCSEVLEHVGEPEAALAEMARVVRPGGALVLSVPFLARLHEEPHDYYRYTEHGLEAMLGRNGFTVEQTEITGSVGAFLGHQVATAVIGSTWHVPVLRWLAYGVNAAFVVAPALLVDRLLGPLGRKLPLGYVVTANRRTS